MRNLRQRAFLLFILLVLTACGSAPAAEQTTQAPKDTASATVAAAATATPLPAKPTVAEVTPPPTDTPAAPDTPLPQADTPIATDTPVPPTAAAPTDTPVPPTVAAPTDTPVPPTVPPADTPQPLFYNLPATKLTTATGLYASPNRAELIVPVPIPEGETVYAMGRNATGSHLRVVWNTGVGWVPVSFTDYNGKRDRLQALPIFEREPPACAEPITTQFGLNSEWSSDKKQKVVVMADLFRSQYGAFPPSFLSIKVNGELVPSTRRQIKEQGQFSLKDVVFTLPGDLQPGDTISYLLDTSSAEPLTFMATLFSVPSNCKWKLD